MSAVIPRKRALATIHPPGMKALMLDGQSADGRTNQAKNDIRPFHGDMSPLPVGVSASSKAVCHAIPTVR